MKTLYKFQEKASEECFEKKKCILSLPTGAGKTLTSIHWAKKWSLPVVILAHRKTKIKDWYLETKRNGIEAYVYTDHFNFHKIVTPSRYVLIIDETTENGLKNKKAKKWEKVRKLVENSDGALLLTADIIVKNHKDIIAQLELLGVDYKKERDHFSLNGGIESWIDNESTIAQMISEKYIVRYEKEDVSEVLELSPIQKNFIEATNKYMHAYTLSQRHSTKEILAKWKVPFTIDHLETLKEKKVVVFSKFISSMKMLKNYFGEKAILINGEVKNKNELLEKFMQDDTQFLILSTGVGSHGLDGLQHVCNRVVFNDVESLGANIYQSIARVHRKGQTKQVVVDFVAEKHLEGFSINHRLEEYDKTQARFGKDGKELWKEYYDIKHAERGIDKRSAMQKRYCKLRREGVIVI